MHWIEPQLEMSRPSPALDRMPRVAYAGQCLSVLLRSRAESRRPQNQDISVSVVAISGKTALNLRTGNTGVGVDGRGSFGDVSSERDSIVRSFRRRCNGHGHPPRSAASRSHRPSREAYRGGGVCACVREWSRCFSIPNSVRPPIVCSCVN